jgi:hypothetical protein
MSVQFSSTGSVQSAQSSQSAHLGQATNSNTQAQTGLSSVSDRISSAADNSCSCASGVCGIIASPFIAIGNFFAGLASRVVNFFSSLFASAENDAARIDFIKNNLNALSGQVYEDALDKFSHISNPKEKVAAFKMIQNSPDVTAEATKAFYDLLPVDTQNHLERHIWIENGRTDNSQGLHFGKNLINSDIKAALVSQALDKCLSESA